MYLDTSVISYLKQEDSPERMADTLKFWEMLENDVFDVYLSEVTIREVNKCYEPKRSFLMQNLDKIKYVTIDIEYEQEGLTQKIIEKGILSKRHAEDCRHIASAVIANCDYLLSWNFKDLVNISTIQGVRSITELENYKPINIVTPSFMLSYNNGGMAK